MRALRVLIIAAVLAFAAGGCVSSEDPVLVEEGSGSSTTVKAFDPDEGTGDSDSSEPAATETTVAEGPETFAVGDTVGLGDYEILVHGVTDPLPPNVDPAIGMAFVEPAAGNRFVGVDLEVTNTSAEPQLFSGFVQVELQDSENFTYSATFTDHTPEAPDGELQVGQAKRGLLVFEVPEGAQGLTLTFTGDLFATGGAVIELS